MPVIATDAAAPESASDVGGWLGLGRRVVARQSQHGRKALGGGNRGAWFGDDREVVPATIEQVDAEHSRVVEQVAQVGRRHRAAGLGDKAAGAGFVHDRPSHTAVEIVEQAAHLRRGEFRAAGLLEDRRGAVEHARACVAGRPVEVVPPRGAARGASDGPLQCGRHQALRAILERFRLQFEAAERQHIRDAMVQLRLKTQRRVGRVLTCQHGHAPRLGERAALVPAPRTR